MCIMNQGFSSTGQPGSIGLDKLEHVIRHDYTENSKVVMLQWPCKVASYEQALAL